MILHRSEAEPRLGDPLDFVGYILLTKRSPRQWLLLAMAGVILVVASVLLVPEVTILYDQIPLVLIFLVLVRLNYVIGGRDVLYPGFIFSFVWLFALSFYVFSLTDVDDISPTTDWIIVVGCVFFSIGSFVASRRPHFRLAWLKIRASKSGLGMKIALGYVLCIFPLFYLDLARAAGGFSPTDLVNVRLVIIQLLSDSKSPYSSILSSSLPAIAVFVALVWVLDQNLYRAKAAMIFAFVLALIIGILTTARTQILQLILGVAGAYLFRQKERLSFSTGLRKALPFFLVFVLLVGGLPLFTKTETQASDSPASFVGTLLLRYVIGNFPALDKLLLHPHDFVSMQYFGFQQLMPLLNWIGVNTPRQDHAFGAFVYVPFPMNTYTVYLTAYLPFGFAGVMLFSLFLGMAHGYIYWLARQGSEIGLFLYCVYLYPLVMTIFADQYLGNAFFHHAEVLLFAFVYYNFLRGLFFDSGKAVSSKPENQAVPEGRL